MAHIYNFSTINALVIEDSKFMCTIMRTILVGLEFNSIHFTMDLKSIRETIIQNDISIVFTDWELGEFTGQDIVKAIRQSSEDKISLTPIVALSAHTDIHFIKQMLASGVDDVMVKPISPQAMYSRLVRLIEEPPKYVRGPDYLGPKRNVANFMVA